MAKKKTDTRKISCNHCGKEHYIQHGGWVITADKKTYCYDSEGGCHAKMRVLRSDSATNTSKETRKVDILKEFESW